MQELIHSLLQEHKLIIADVGATGGPEIRWKKWVPLCFFYTFDPDPRAKTWESPSKNFPVGLWSHRSSQNLHLAAHPPASSLFRPNYDFIASFPNLSGFEEIGQKRIELQTLDQTLKGEGVDFLKIDAEGAELEILKGGIRTLANNCLAMQLEVLFSPLRQNAPTFSELDQFARSFDFQIFHIEREHWIRKNKIACPNSAPQLIFGNALYLLQKRIFLKRLRDCENPRPLLGKYLTILLAYNLYDYAYEICEEAFLEETVELKKALKKITFSKKQFVNLFFSLATGLGKYALTFSPPKKQNRLSYLKRKIRELGQHCLFLGRNDFGIYD